MDNHPFGSLLLSLISLLHSLKWAIAFQWLTMLSWECSQNSKWKFDFFHAPMLFSSDSSLYPSRRAQIGIIIVSHQTLCRWYFYTHNGIIFKFGPCSLSIRLYKNLLECWPLLLTLYERQNGWLLWFSCQVKRVGWYPSKIEIVCIYNFELIIPVLHGYSYANDVQIRCSTKIHPYSSQKQGDKMKWRFRALPSWMISVAWFTYHSTFSVVLWFVVDNGVLFYVL